MTPVEKRRTDDRVVVLKKVWHEPAVVMEQWLVARAQDPVDPTDPLYAEDPFLGPLNTSTP